MTYFYGDNLTKLESKYYITYQYDQKYDHSKFILEENFPIEKDLEHKDIIKSRYTNRDTAVQISSSVTSYARIILHKLKNQSGIGKLYYSDTDSIFVDNSLSSDLVSNEILGKLKLVHEIKEAVFLGPKSY